MLSDDESTWFLPVPPVSQLPQGWWWRWRLGGGGLDSKTVENGGYKERSEEASGHRRRAARNMSFCQIGRADGRLAHYLLLT